MPRRIANVLTLAALFGVALLLLVPTGMCICADGEELTATEEHPPGCPEVRNLDRPAMPDHYVGDDTVVVIITPNSESCSDGPVRPVDAVAHGPPRGQPIYLAFQTLLI